MHILQRTAEYKFVELTLSHAEYLVPPCFGACPCAKIFAYFAFTTLSKWIYSKLCCLARCTFSTFLYPTLSSSLSSSGNWRNEPLWLSSINFRQTADVAAVASSSTASRGRVGGLGGGAAEGQMGIAEGAPVNVTSCERVCLIQGNSILL